MTSIKSAEKTWGWRGLDDLLGDLRFGVRMLRKNPVLALVAVLTLALGIGANTAIFTLLYGLVLRSLPAHNPGELVKVGIASAAYPDEAGAFMPYRMLEAFRAQGASFRELSAWTGDYVLMKDHEGLIQGYDAGLVSGNAFGLLGLQPYRGRLIEAYDDVRGGPSNGWPVVLSYSFWNGFYGRAEDIIGKQITISDTRVTVVGVTLPDFKGVWPGDDVKMYFPLQFVTVLEKKDVLGAADNLFGVEVIGRLKPGVSLRQANAELGQLQQSLLSRFIPDRFRHDPFFEKAYLMASSARNGLPKCSCSDFDTLRGLAAYDRRASRKRSKPAREPVSFQILFWSSRS